MKKLILLLAICILLLSCSERYNLETNTYEESLVVEATITNELKNQEVKLTKTYRLEAYGPTVETGANVYVSDNLGNQYTFAENAGTYKSVTPFQALQGRSYQLHFTTSNGKSYESTSEQTPTATQLQDITTEVVTKEGVRGVQMSAQSFDPTNTSKYYRYEYEETYKIIAPKWVPYRAVVTGPQEMRLLNWTEETQTCFKTEYSNEVILSSSNDLLEDRINQPIRFISVKDWILTHRYSILVKQYVQNLKSYNYFRTLKLISANGNSVLSQNQPGFLKGNLINISNTDEKVIGFFDVNTISKKRIFFNFFDIFSGENLPKYPFDCREFSNSVPPVNLTEYYYCFNPSSFPPYCLGDAVFGNLQSGLKAYYGPGVAYGSVIPLGIFVNMFNTSCIKCNSFNNNSNIRPTFWID